MADGAYERETSLGFLVNLAGRLLARALERKLVEHGVSLGQFPLLLTLWEQDALTQTEIARRLDIEQPTVANTLKRMERDGLVVAASDPAHGRRVLFSLTTRARRLEPVLKAEAQGVNGRASRGVSDAEMAQFRATLASVIRALQDDSN